MLKYNIICITVFIAFIFSVNSQELPLHYQYLFNDFFLNPAITGSEGVGIAKLTDRQQWLGVQGAPQTGAFSLQMPLGNRNAVGGYVVNDMTGAIKNREAQLSYAFHSTIARKRNSPFVHRLSFGVSFSFSQFTIDQRGFILTSDYDPRITGTIEKITMSDVDFGVYLYSNNYFVGLSLEHVLQSFLKSENLIYNEIYLFFNVGYKHRFNDYFAIEPSVLLKKREKSDVKFDINTKLYFRPKTHSNKNQRELWVGFSFRTYLPDAYYKNKAMLFLLGLDLPNNLSMGYAFDYTTGMLTSNSLGSHEFMLAYKFGQKNSKSVPCPSFSKGKSHSKMISCPAFKYKKKK